MNPCTFKVAVNGSDITAVIADRLESLVVTDSAGVDSDSVALTLDDRGQAIILPAIDAEMEVWMGYILNDVPDLKWMGLFIIDELETSDQEGTLSIHGKSANMLGALKAPRDESYHDITLGQLVNTIAQRHGYEAAIDEALASKKLEHIDQRAQSDIDLLTSKAQALGALCKIVNKQIVILTEDASKTATGTTLPPLDLNATALGLYVDARIAGKSSYGAVKAYYQKPDDSKKTWVSVGGGEPVYTMIDIYSSHGEAREEAMAKWAKLKRGGTELNIDLPGNTDAKAERTVKLINHRHQGNYVIKESQHEIGSGNAFASSIVLREPAKTE